MEWFNFTKISDIELYHDIPNSANDPKIKGFFVALMVKPDLNLPDPSKFDNNAHNVNENEFRVYNLGVQQKKIFRGIINKHIYYNLTHNDGFNYFSNIISNRIESISYPDIGSNSEDTLVTLDKAIFKLPVTETGTSGMTFVMKLRENEALDCLRMMTTWHKYIHAITKGNIYPKNEYLDYNIIDYKASLYILHLKPDFKTITMCTKYTGIYPTNIPVSSFSEDLSNIQDVSIDVEFTYDKFELMHEDLIKEINMLCAGVAINKTVLENSSDYSLHKSSPFKNNKLIKRIKNSPFYFVDFNGLTQMLVDKVSIDKQPASLFGQQIQSTYNSLLFPAASNLEQIELSSGRSKLTGRQDKKFIEERK